MSASSSTTTTTPPSSSLDASVRDLRAVLGEDSPLSDSELRRALNTHRGDLSAALNLLLDRTAAAAASSKAGAGNTFWLGQKASRALAADEVIVLEDSPVKKPRRQSWPKSLGRRAMEAESTIRASTPKDMQRGCVLAVRRDRLAKAPSTIIRLVTASGSEVGRLPSGVSGVLAPLLDQNLLSCTAAVEFVPDRLGFFTQFGVQVEFFVMGPKSFDCFDAGAADSAKAAEDGGLADNMWKCIQMALGRFTPQGCYPTEYGSIISLLEDEEPAPNLAAAPAAPLDADASEERELELGDALFGPGPRDDPLQYSPLSAPPAGLRVTLRPYQAEAAGWMMWRESLQRDDGSRTRPSQRHPLWERMDFADGTPFHVNAFTYQATLGDIPPVVPCRGGILGDAMGMGKTISTLALLLSDNPKDPRPPSLIVAPTSLVAQWESELACKVDPGRGLAVLMYHGSQRDADALLSADVVLTTYGVCAAEFAAKKNSRLFTTQWRRIVLDEAHCIRNEGTAQAKAAMALRADGRWCLTGTPVHNSINDLLQLFQFIKLQPWDQPSFWKRAIEKPHLAGDASAMTRLRAVLADGPILMRRTMDQIDPATGREIVTLPPLDVQVVELEFSPPERDFYKSIFNRSQLQFEGLVASGNASKSYIYFLSLLVLAKKGDKEDSAKQDREYIARVSSKYFALQPGQGQVAARAMQAVAQGGEAAECPICLCEMEDPVLTRCAHSMCRRCCVQSLQYFGSMACPICREKVDKNELVALALPSRSGGAVVDASGALVGSTAEDLISQRFCASSKLERLVAEVDAARQRGDKMLVFTQFLTMMDLVAAALDRMLPPVKFHRLDGSMSVSQRKKALGSFKDDPECAVLVMSLKAGCLGLNITAANVVILLDPWWTFAVEAQAIGRCHRIGQTRPVTVKRFVMKDSVEMQMLQVQTRKNQVMDALGLNAAPGELDEKCSKLTLEDFGMFFRSSTAEVRGGAPGGGAGTTFA